MLVAKLAARGNVRFGEKQSECALEGLNETRRLNIDLLRLGQLFAEVLSLHDVELWDEGVNRLTLLVDIARIFKLSSQMQQLLNLVLVLENAVDPALSKSTHLS